MSGLDGSPSKTSAATRIAAGLTSGILTCVAVSGAISLALMAMNLPVPISLWLVFPTMAGAVFLAGWVARLVAGPYMPRGWLGVTCVLTLMAIGYILQPFASVYTREHGWVYLDAMSGTGSRVVVMRGYSAFLRLISVVAGVSLAALGDICAARRRSRMPSD